MVEEAEDECNVGWLTCCIQLVGQILASRTDCWVWRLTGARAGSEAVEVFVMVTTEWDGLWLQN